MMNLNAIKKIKIICAMLCLSALMIGPTGCMDEDFSRCPGANIYFRYTLHPHGGDRVADEIKRITVYVFDSQKRYVGTYPEPKRLADGTFFLPIDDITPGKYSFVALGNLSEHFDVTPCTVGITLMDQARFTFNNNNSNTFTGDCLADGFFHGCVLDADIRTTAKGKASATICLTKNTNAVRVILSIGKETTRAQSRASGATPEFSCAITSDNTTCKFDNSIVSSGQRLYMPQVKQEGGKTISDFVILREMNDGSTGSRLLITHHRLDGTTEQVRSLPLAPLLLAASQSKDLDIDDNYTLNITLDYTGTTTTIIINGWEINQGGGVVG